MFVELSSLMGWHFHVCAVGPACKSYGVRPDVTPMDTGGIAPHVDVHCYPRWLPLLEQYNRRGRGGVCRTALAHCADEGRQAVLYGAFAELLCVMG